MAHQVPGTTGGNQDRSGNTPLHLRRDPTGDVDNRDVAFTVLYQPSQVTENLFCKLASWHQNQRSRALARIVLEGGVL